MKGPLRVELDLQDMLIQLFSQKDSRNTWRVRKQLMKHIADYSTREHRSVLLENVIETNHFLLRENLTILGKFVLTLLTRSQG